jgi:hypothetical protein
MTTTTDTEPNASPTVGLSVLVPPTMRNELAAMACDESRSIGSMTRILLAEALDRRADGGGR